MTRATVLLAAALLVVQAFPATVAAADESAEVEKAREKFTRAIKEQNAGHWDRALALLQEVVAVKSTPQVRFNIALCEEHLGQLRQAIDDYALAAKEARAEGVDKVANEADSRRGALEQRMPHVVVHRGPGTADATILLDGKSLDASRIDKPIVVDPGSHVVEATSPGAPPFKKSFDVSEGKTEEVMVVIQVPGKPIEAKKPKPKPEPARRSILPFVVGGIGAASLVASGVFFVLRRGTISTLDDKCGSDRASCPESERDTYNRGKTYNTLTNVTLVVGVVGVGAGVALYVLGSPKERTGAALVPAAPAALGGASLVGHF